METNSTYKHELPLLDTPYGKLKRIMNELVVYKDGTPMPKTVGIEDIDNAMKEWIEKGLDISNGETKIPVFVLMSNQRISEYAQSWLKLDVNGNLNINFFTLTKELAGQNGADYLDGIQNIPGEQRFPMGYIPVMQKNGLVAYDVYLAKQPNPMNLTYTLMLVTNKIKLLNEVNEKITRKFDAIYNYIQPNGYYMPIFLDTVSDDSEYNIDDRRYYSQSYTITVKGFTYREEDFSVVHLPQRLEVMLPGTHPSHHHMSYKEIVFKNPCNAIEIDDLKYVESRVELILPYNPKESVCKPMEYSIEYQYKEGYDTLITDFETVNIREFKVLINGEEINYDEEYILSNGDTITLYFAREVGQKEAKFVIVGYDPNEIVDKDSEEYKDYGEIVKETEISGENTPNT